MSYGQAFTELSGVMVALLAAGPPAGARLPERDVDGVLDARDTLVAELRQLVRQLLLAGPASRVDLTLRHIATDPAHVMHDALCDLAGARSGGGPDSGQALAEAARDSGGRAGLAGRWLAAARCAVQLERYHDRLAELPAPAAWTALRDVTELAAAVPYLDADLAAALPGGSRHSLTALQAPVPHALLRLSSEQLRRQLTGLPAAPYDGHLDTAPTRPVVLRTAQDLPVGMRRLTAVLRELGPDLAAVDARTVVRLLAAGVEQVRRHAPGIGPAGVAAAAAAARALPALRGMALESFATLTARDPRLVALASEIGNQLRQPGRQPANALLVWAVSAGSVARAIETAVDRAVRDGKVFVHPHERTPSRQQHLLWVPLTSAGGMHPLLHNTRAAREALQHARPAIERALADVDSPAPEQRAVRAAARSAGTAVDQLRTAIARQAGRPGAAPDRPPHPAQRWPPQGGIGRSR